MDTVKETGTSWEGRWGWKGDGNGRRVGRRERGGQWGMGSKRHPLVEDVSEYYESYEVDSANYVRHL